MFGELLLAITASPRDRASCMSVSRDTTRALYSSTAAIVVLLLCCKYSIISHRTIQYPCDWGALALLRPLLLSFTNMLSVTQQSQLRNSDARTNQAIVTSIGGHASIGGRASITLLDCRRSNHVVGHTRWDLERLGVESDSSSLNRPNTPCHVSPLAYHGL